MGSGAGVLKGACTSVHTCPEGVPGSRCVGRLPGARGAAVREEGLLLDGGAGAAAAAGAALALARALALDGVLAPIEGRRVVRVSPASRGARLADACCSAQSCFASRPLGQTAPHATHSLKGCSSGTPRWPALSTVSACGSRLVHSPVLRGTEPWRAVRYSDPTLTLFSPARMQPGRHARSGRGGLLLQPPALCSTAFATTATHP